MLESWDEKHCAYSFDFRNQNCTRSVQRCCDLRRDLALRLHRSEFFFEFLNLFFYIRFEVCVRHRTQRLLQRHQSSDYQRLIRRHADVRRHACAFPVRFRDRTDRTSGWYKHSEVFTDAETATGMRAAAGRLTDDRRALEVLQ